jgi:hypothetical protein
MQVAQAPPCHAGIPSAAQLLSDPAFAALTFHKREDYNVMRGIGYDVWGDARFEYRTALQFSLIPVAGARSDDELCVQAVSLKFALPAEPQSRERLRGFTRLLALSSGLDAARLQAQLEQALDKGDKFHVIEAVGAVSVQGGTLMHPTRGAFFVVSFDWKAP